MRTTIAGFSLVLFLLCANSAQGQVPWDSPLMVGSGSPAGLSVLLADPGGGIGAFGHWLGRVEGNRMGIRVGVAEEGGPDEDLAVYGGLDVSGGLMSHSAEFPLDLAWVAGVGAGVGTNTLLSIPFGVAFGRVLTTEEVWVHPYLTPRFVVDAYLGDQDRDDLELGFALDLGVDFAFSGSWAVRFGAAVGDREGVAIGVMIPTG